MSRNDSVHLDKNGALGRSPWHRRCDMKRLWPWLLGFAVFAFCHDWLVAADEHTEPADTEAAVMEVYNEAATEDAHGEEHADAHGEGGAGHSDPVAPILMALIVILLLAKISGDVFDRVGLPPVLGELVVGILLGNCALLTGWHGLDFFHAPPAHAMGDPYAVGAVIKMLAGIGVVLLLFEVGLESTVREMMSVGKSSFLVAIFGVVAPMILGWGVCWFLIPEQGWQVHVFVGATLCATSVGITARVLKDLGKHQQKESQIILGAAVIDDVLGLIVLAVVSGIIMQSRGGAGESVSVTWELVKITGLAFIFLGGSVFLGATLIARPLFRAASFLRGHGLLVATALVICFGFAWLANAVGLAPIVGAFAAGLILERAQYRELGEKENIELEHALAPLSGVLVPIFFVQMGIQVDLSTLQDPSVWGLAAAITVMAVIGKQVCAWGVQEKELNRTAVGLGMIPRGEVGLIFADQGSKLGVVLPGTYAAVVFMVMITTMVTPPLLKWSLTKDDPEGGDEAEGQEESAAGEPPSE